MALCFAAWCHSLFRMNLYYLLKSELGCCLADVPNADAFLQMVVLLSVLYSCQIVVVVAVEAFFGLEAILLGIHGEGVEVDV